MGRKGKNTRNMAQTCDGNASDAGHREKAAVPVPGERYFRSLIENSLDIITVINADGTIRYVSPSITKITGLEPGEREGKGIFDLIHADDLPKVISAWPELLENRNTNQHMELRIRHISGSWRFLEAVASNLLDDPEVEGIVINSRDITERRQTEEDLRIKENALENSINAIAMTNMEGKITYVNRACMKMWGGTGKEELVGRPYWVLLQSDEIVKDILAAITVNQSWAGQIAAKRKDGREVSVQVATSIVKDDDGNPIQTISSFVDVTEREKAETALRESEEKFRRFVEEMSDCYCVIQGAKIVFTNARGAEMFGYARDEVVGKTIHEFLPPEIVKELADAHKRRRRGERMPSQYATTLITKEGIACPVEFGVSLIMYAGRPAVSLVIRDVAERRQIEEALRESETRFRTIFEGAAISMALVSLKGEPLAINPAMQNMFGYSLDDFNAMLPTDYLHPEDAMADADLFLEMAAGKRDHYHIEKRYIRKDGELIWSQQDLYLVRDTEGKPKYVIAMMDDVTERKKAEEERLRLEEQLQLAGRLAAVGELAAGVAHELNNPLTAVQAFAQLLVSRDDLDDAVKADLETIYREAQRATKITGNLLSFARRHEPEKRLVSINDVLEKSLELHAYQMKLSSIEVLPDLEPDLPMTLADPHQMHQVFVNIIRNAEHAMAEARGRGRFRVKTESVNGMLRITFADDGPGIAEGNPKSIFDPFFTTKDVGEGTGLGLSICYGIVEGHGGRIYAKSKTGRGATFVVEVPVYSGDDIIAEEADSTHALLATTRYL